MSFKLFPHFSRMIFIIYFLNIYEMISTFWFLRFRSMVVSEDLSDLEKIDRLRSGRRVPGPSP